MSELTGLLGLEELDALGDDLIEVGLVLGLVGGHGGEWWRPRREIAEEREIMSERKRSRGGVAAELEGESTPEASA